MKLQLGTSLQLLAALTLTLAALSSSSAQTSDELRAKYGQPEVVKTSKGRAEVERYRVRPEILLTVTYTAKGQLCEMEIEPVPSVPAKEDGVGDVMPTGVVVELINELVPAALRGKKLGEGSLNGGDPAMRLNHAGCAGVYYVMYERVSISCSSWCQGGTFSAIIHFGETKCRNQQLTINKRK